MRFGLVQIIRREGKRTGPSHFQDGMSRPEMARTP
jgi:hypothetical protein